jgi:lysophospholipase L1-like esterase
MWCGSWYGSVALAPAGAHVDHLGLVAPRFADATLSTILHLTLGGDRLRVRFSNLYGRTWLAIGAAHATSSAGTRPITFDGRPAASIAPGGSVTSDPVDLVTTSGENLVVSVFYPEPIPELITLSRFSAERNILSPGKVVAFEGGGAFGRWIDGAYFLTAVDVDAAGETGTIVALGDSITVGGTTRWPPSADLGVSRRWPARLARRLHEAGRAYGVVNAGIVGNRLLRDGDDGSLGGANLMFGPRAVSRFERDVVDQPRVRYAILSVGINDIGLAPVSSYAVTTLAADLVGAMQDLTAQAERRDVRLYLTTLTPFERSERLPPEGFYRPEKNDLRLQVNEWIRTSGVPHGYIDFERALADPRSPNRMNPDLDSGDQFHPNDAGERALGDAIDLELFA